MEEIIQKLNKDGFLVTRVFGDSMYPMLKSNYDRVVIENKKDINRFDVCLYISGDHLLLHRFIKRINDDVYLRGDNTLRLEKVNINDIKGVLKAYYHKDKYISVNEFINKKYYIYSIISYPFRLLIGKLKQII